MEGSATIVEFEFETRKKVTAGYKSSNLIALFSSCCKYMEK